MGDEQESTAGTGPEPTSEQPPTPSSGAGGSAADPEQAKIVGHWRIPHHQPRPWELDGWHRKSRRGHA